MSTGMLLEREVVTVPRRETDELVDFTELAEEAHSFISLRIR